MAAAYPFKTQNDEEDELEQDVEIVRDIVQHMRRYEIREQLLILTMQGVEDRVERLIDAFVLRSDNQGPPPPMPKDIEDEELEFAGVLPKMARLDRPQKTAGGLQPPEELLSLNFAMIMDMFPDCEVEWLLTQIKSNYNRGFVTMQSLAAEMLERGYPKEMYPKENPIPNPEPTHGHFEMIDGHVPATHSFCPGETFYRSLSAATPRRILREHTILNNGLPRGVIVKTFSSNLHLLSVMICGPKGTIYEGAVFFFDVRLPDSYPLKPPELKYICFHDFPLNPNLYVEGRVCLSLLGTWTKGASQSEMWDPASSTLLQVFVSIQGLILNAEPYFNEAEYENRFTEEDRQKSGEYNERSLGQVLISMARVLRNPPEIFEKEVKEHFKNTGRETLARLSSLMTENPVKLEFPLPQPLTSRFRACLRPLLLDFSEALESAGL